MARWSSDSMVSIRIVVGVDGFGVAATAVRPTEVTATTTRPAKPTPATATLCLFMGTGTRFACKIACCRVYRKCRRSADTIQLSLQKADDWTSERGLSLTGD